MYIRELNNKPLTLIVSGMLWRNSLVMMDEESGSWWSHVTGQCLKGEYKGKKLTTIPAVQTTWQDWKTRHPKTELLVKSQAIRSSQYEKYFSDSSRTGLFRTFYLRDKMPGKAMVYGISLQVYALAVREQAIMRDKLITTVLGDKQISVVLLGGKTARCFETPGLDLRKTEEADGMLIDASTGSKWDLSDGICITGQRKGEKLKEIAITKAFWFAWSAFYPNTEVIE